MAVSVTEIEAGRAFITLDLKTVGTWGKKIQQQAARLKTAAMQMGTSAIIMATPFVAGAKVFADFSKQMAFVATMLDEPQAHMARFTASIRTMSVEFGESTATLTRGLYDILSAGFAPVQALEMLTVTTTAAKAGMADAASATQAIVAVLNSYSLSAEHAQMVSDSLFTTVRKGVLTFGELAGHIGMVSSTAAAAGVTIDEMGAALAIITRGGVETSHAVVALNNILKAFLSPTGASAEFAKKLATMGLGPISLAGIKQKGFLNILKEIGALPPDMIARILPSIRGMRGIMAIKAGLTDIDEIFKAWTEKAGATQEAMKNIEASFGHLVDRVKQGAVLILSYIGEAMVPSLTKFGERVIHVALGFGEWIKHNKEMIVQGAKLIATLAGLAVTLLIVAKAMAIIGTIMAVIAGPAGLLKLTAGILAAGIAWNLMGRAIGSVKDELKGIADIGRVKLLEEEKKLLEEIAQINRKIADIEGKQESKRVKPLPHDVNLVLRDIGWTGIAKQLEMQEKVSTGLVDWYKGLQAEHEANWRILGWFQDTERGVRFEKARLEIMKKRLESNLKDLSTEKEKAKILEAQKESIEKQTAALEKISGFSKRGFFMGFQHTPVLSFAASGRITEETADTKFLEEIAKSTRSDGSLVLAIKESKPETL